MVPPSLTDSSVSSDKLSSKCEGVEFMRVSRIGSEVHVPFLCLRCDFPRVERAAQPLIYLVYKK